MVSHLMNQNPFMDAYLTSAPQITFLKSVYRRHTDLLKKKETITFKNGLAKIPKHNVISILQNVWIDNWQNIDELYVLMTSLSERHIRQFVDSNSKSNDKIYIIDKLSLNALKLYNNIVHPIETAFNKKHQEKFISIPCHTLAFVPKLLAKANKQIVFAIKYKDNVSKKNTLHAKYSISNDRDETKKFIQYSHEYLVKRFVTHKINLKKGKNKINWPYINIPVIYMCLIAEKKSELKIKVKHNVKILGEEIATNTHKLNEISDDPDNFEYQHKDFDTFVLNQGESLNFQSLSFQPTGHFKMEIGSHIIIESKKVMSIDIIYSLYNVLRYYRNDDQLSQKVEFAYTLNKTESELDAIRTAELLDENYMASYMPTIEKDCDKTIINENDRNVGHCDNTDRFEMPREIAWYNGLTQANGYYEEDKMINPYGMSKISKKDYLLNKFDKLYKLIELFEFTNCIKKRIKDENAICCIDHERIKEKEFYYKCDKCTMVCRKDNLEVWMSMTSSDNLRCMICNREMDSIMPLYVNTEDESNSRDQTSNVI